jgi:hypothetical protein
MRVSALTEKQSLKEQIQALRETRQLLKNYDKADVDAFLYRLEVRLGVIASMLVPIEQTYAFGNQKNGSDALRKIYKLITGQEPPKGLIEVW